MAKQFKKTARKVQKVIKKVTPVATKSGRVAGKVTMPTGEYIATIGRRKTATARIRLFMKPGDFVVNDIPMTEYFNTVRLPESRFLAPFRATDTLGRFAVSVKVNGSGTSAQLDAVVLGVARALVKVDSGYKAILRKAGLMTRDDRMKETRKPNMGGKARRKRQSPKR